MAATTSSTQGDLFDSIDVYEAEWQTIERRPHRTADEPLPPGEAPRRRHTPPHGLTGLALSGGGIRSATFNLGVLQALGRERMLRHVDYLSTVSGGGYIGGWWSAWLARPGRTVRDGGFPAAEAVEPWRHDLHVQPARCRACHREPAVPAFAPFCSAGCRQAGARPAAPDPIHHVRLFANYLTPRKGAFSNDLWRAITIVSRNVVLTWLVLIPILAIPVLLAQALFAWEFAAPGRLAYTGSLDHVGERFAYLAAIPLTFIGTFAALSVAWLMLQRGTMRRQWIIALAALGALLGLAAPLLPAPPSSAGSGLVLLVLGVAAAHIWGVQDVVRLRRAGADDRSGAEPEQRGSWRDRQINRIARLQGVALLGAAVGTSVAAVAAFGHQVVDYALMSTGAWLGPDPDYAHIAANVCGYATVAATVVSAIHAARKGAPAGGAESAATTHSRFSRVLLGLAPPLVLLMLVLVIAWLGATAAASPDLERWATVMKNITVIGIFAMVGFAWTEEDGISREVILPSVLLTAAVAGSIANDTVAANLAIARLAFAGVGVAAALIAWRVAAHLRTVRRSEWLLAGATAAALVAVGISAGTIPGSTQAGLLLGLCGALWSTVVILGWTTDPNTLSLHTFYKMRLVRAYLGASNPVRTGQDAEDVTETKPNDDVLLTAISDPSVDAPYHLVNGTLNLTAGSDLTIAQRAAAPFLFSRCFCGSVRTGFRRTSEYRAGSLTLGSAVAISGAAASPVMGPQTPSTALSMLMALLNVRLGYWLPTPSHYDWRAPQARLWPFYLLREFLSQTADTGRYCYVTDGGHFDNTGAYALIERGCRVIVLSDCGADPDSVFDDLSTLIRRCRIDFGAVITFDTLEPFSRETVAANRQHFVAGRVEYSLAHLTALGWTAEEIAMSGRTATLIVIKPTLASMVETDVRRYSQINARFPQQTTADQWFDEAQFESYRRLGERSGDAAMVEVTKAITAALPRQQSQPLP